MIDKVWGWSSVRAHLDPARGDGLTGTAPVLDRAEDFAALLRNGEDEALPFALRRVETVGRPRAIKPSLDGSNARSAAIRGRESGGPAGQEQEK